VCDCVAASPLSCLGRGLAGFRRRGSPWAWRCGVPYVAELRVAPRRQGPAALRSAGALPAPRRATLLPSARSARAAPTRAHGQRKGMGRNASTPSDRQSSASGGGAQAPRWRRRRSRVPAHRGERADAPIPSAIDPGGAEQTRPLAFRSFVQWRAPPGRQEPRPLHSVWADGRRDGSQGKWWVGGYARSMSPRAEKPRMPALAAAARRRPQCGVPGSRTEGRQRVGPFRGFAQPVGGNPPQDGLELAQGR
jgi:hypothetical protein